MQGDKSKYLMSRGFMEMRQSPTRLVVTVRRFRNPATSQTVTLIPMPNFASPQYFLNQYYNLPSCTEYDRILFEDGYLPLIATDPRSSRAKVLCWVLPFLPQRLIVSNAEKCDGLVQRDPFESRMAYNAALGGADPPVDPRARRAVDRILSYPSGTRVACPWNVYHVMYFTHKLAKVGYVLESSEEAVVVTMTQMLMVLALFGLSTCSIVYFLSTTLQLLFSGLV